MGTGAIEDDGGSVVGTGRVLGGGEGAQPLPGPLAGFPDLGNPLPPASLPHSSVPELIVIRPSFAFTFPAATATATINIIVIIIIIIGTVGILLTRVRGSGSGGGGFLGKVIRLGCTVHIWKWI